MILEFVGETILKNAASCCPNAAAAVSKARPPIKPHLIRFIPATFPNVINVFNFEL